MSRSYHSTRHTLYTRLTAAALSCALLIGGAAYWQTDAAPVATVSAETAEDLRDERQSLLDKQAALQAQLNEAAASLKEVEAEKEKYKQLIDLKIQEIEIQQKLVDELDSKIADKNHEIALKQQALAEKEAAISDSLEELRSRLRTISKTGSLTSMLQLLMSSENFTDYLIKSKAMQRLSEDNSELMAKLEAEMEVINADKAALEAEKAVIEEERRPIVEEQTKLTTSKQELDVLYSKLTVTTDKLNQDIDNYNASIAQAEADAKMLQDKLNEMLAQNINNGQSFVSGSMYWPAPSCNYISSTFKVRWGRQHQGIDICGSGCYGTPLVAAADGIVTHSGWMGGYGYCVWIDHGSDSQGRNVTTIYAHASSLNVSVGQAVTGGQTKIGAIGASGNVTGPHLHFEVRVNGTAVDPLGNGYLSTAGGIIIDESL